MWVPMWLYYKLQYCEMWIDEDIIILIIIVIAVS